MKLLPIAALFLPLFPLSMVLNGLLTRLPNPATRCVLLLLWPQAGAALVTFFSPAAIPPYFIPWALFTAGLYALRLLTVRDMGVWAGFLATSALALTWVLTGGNGNGASLHLLVFWLSLPPALLALLAHPLARRFGAAYAGLQGGLIRGLPRLSGLIAMTMLAAVATPPFPGFFALLAILHALDWAGALGGLLIWLIWGWAAIRLLQGLIFGAERPSPAADIGQGVTMAFSAVLSAFLIAGLYLTGGGL